MEIKISTCYPAFGFTYWFFLSIRRLLFHVLAQWPRQRELRFSCVKSQPGDWMVLKQSGMRTLFSVTVNICLSCFWFVLHMGESSVRKRETCPWRMSFACGTWQNGTFLHACYWMRLLEYFGDGVAKYKRSCPVQGHFCLYWVESSNAVK